MTPPLPHPEDSAAPERARIERVLAGFLSAPLPREELNALVQRLQLQEDQTEILRLLPLDREEPFLAPSLEDRP